LCPNEAKSDDNLWGIGAFSLLNNIPLEKGIYLIIYKVIRDFNCIINNKFYVFNRGYLIYIGSAGNGLRNRLKRHINKEGKLRWHIDYISHREKTEVVGLFYREGDFGVKFEDELSHYFYSKIKHIDRLGSTDSMMPHLYYSKELDIILDILGKLNGKIIIFSKIFEKT
jgi:Uri superfamily endonuclease